jgi:hypothetical protein
MKNYEWYKEHHICTQCLKETAMPGRTLCYECAEKSIERGLAYRTKNRESIRAKSRADYIKRKEKGLCRCGRPAREGKSLCAICAAKDNKRHIERRHSAGKTMPLGLRKELHICLRCEKTAVEGYCYCAEHLQKQRAYISKAVEVGKHNEKVKAARRYIKRSMFYGTIQQKQGSARRT